MNDAIIERKNAELTGLPPQMQGLMVVSNRLAKSSIIPKRYIGKPEDILVALQMGYDLGLSSFIVALKEISTINGIPNISSQLGISLANRSGVFSTPIAWKQEGKSWDELRVWAYATRKADGLKCEAEASIKMAVSEGWTKNPKYKSMPVQMLSYRSAMMLIRKFAPQVLLGITVDLEAEAIKTESNIKIDAINSKINNAD